MADHSPSTGKKRQRSAITPDEPNAFAAAVSSALTKDLHGKAPVLAKRKTAAMKLEKQRQEDKAKHTAAVKARIEKRRRHMKAPDAASLTKERRLRRVATKGVVALFNAVRQHQRRIEEEEANKEKRTKAVDLFAEEDKQKDSFLRMLAEAQGTAGAAAGKAPAAAAEEPVADPAKASGWSVLGDDYMASSTLKQWDEDDEGAAAGQML